MTFLTLLYSNNKLSPRQESKNKHVVLRKYMATVRETNSTKWISGHDLVNQV